ncbi:MAG TPA: sigma-70 family RNA polymerase sigma factor [Thermoanaerobaculia bacterium]|nr:sigma-70 family RNA polymerase sigma factor [Thermoanaerobaculia bacterium]
MKQEASIGDPRELLLANLGLIERIVSFACRRQRLDASEAEELAAIVKLKLVENDYAILRKFEGRSRLTTFLSVVIQRLLFDHRIQQWGKWRPSAEASRLGPVAVELERLLHRDGRSLDEAVATLTANDESASRESVAALAGRLPPRPPRRRLVALDEAASLAAPAGEEPFEDDRLRISERVSAIVRRFVEELPGDDRLVFQLRFESGMSVAEIARALRLDQKMLYRNFEKRLRSMREELERAGIAEEEVIRLIGDRGAALDFHLGKDAARPSLTKEGVAAAEQEEISQ